MQIKRFEAADMADALRLVKREFGDDAVILSAKEVRPGGFFSALRKKRVEITAATDYPVDEARKGNDFSGMLTEHLNSDVETDRVSLSSTPPAHMPLGRQFRSISHQQPAPQYPPPSHDGSGAMQAQASLQKAVNADPATVHGGGAGGRTKAVSFRNTPRSPLVAEPFYRDTAARKVIALVGPCGAGKTTTVAKLAWHCRVVEKKRTGLVSLDRFRIGANGMLARVAGIMNLPLSIVHDTEQLQSALAGMADVDVVLIDTPGMSGKDSSMMDEIGSLLRIAEPDEVHLVANATVRDDVFEDCVATFLSLGANRLLLTHVDAHVDETVGLNMVKKGGLLSCFYGDGVDLSDGFHEYTAVGPGGLSSLGEPAGGQVTLFSRNRGPKKTASANSEASGDSVHYLANRNSELFHHPACKSVKRINAENITAFNDIEQAMDEGFKPCRACCDISMIKKSVAEGFGYQRSRAM